MNGDNGHVCGIGREDTGRERERKRLSENVAYIHFDGV